ncbi:MAG: hypothetical protein SGILL_008803 [Bacillariaceae sp.]
MFASKVQGLTSLSISQQERQPFEWDDSAWSPSKRRRKNKDIGIRNEAVAVSDSPKKRYRLDMNNPTLAKAIERCTHPSTNTAAGEIYRRMHSILVPGEQRQKRVFFDIASSPVPEEPFRTLGEAHATMSPSSLYRWLRVRMTAGLVRSSLSIIHKQLQQGYEDAKRMMTKMDDVPFPDKFVLELMAIRDRLASLWCVYVHFILEVGKLTLPNNEHQAKKLQCNPLVSTQSTSDTVERKVTFAGDATIDKMDSLALVGSSRASSVDTIRNDGQKHELGTTVPLLTADTDQIPTTTTKKASRRITNSVSKRRNKRTKKQGGVNRKKQAERSAHVTFQDVARYALSILWNVRACPLVGNHTAVSVCFGRLEVSSLAMKETKVESNSTQLSRGIVIEAIQSAIANCWNVIDSSRSASSLHEDFRLTNSQSKIVHDYLSFVDFPGRKLQHEKRTSHQTLLGELKATLELPRYLRPQGGSLENSSAVFNDQNSKRCLCTELNRWSRLIEKLKCEASTTFRLKPKARVNNGSLAFGEEELPLFALMDVQDSKMELFSADDEEQAMVLWEW